MVSTAPSEVSVASLARELAPSVTVVDCPDTRVVNLDCFLQHQDYPIEVVVTSWNDDNIVVYPRSAV